MFRNALAIWLLLVGNGFGALVQHWTLADNAASTTVVATTGNNATLAGGDNTQDKDTPGISATITSGFNLNGTDDAVDISAASLSFASGSAYSFSLWFRADNLVSTAMSVIGNSGNSNSRISLLSNTSIRVRGSATNIDFTVPALGVTWHHLLVTRTTGDSVRVFVDGVESVTGGQALAETVTPISIGRSSSTYFDGMVAQVRVYNSDESANAATLYAEGVTAGETLSGWSGYVDHATVTNAASDVANFTLVVSMNQFPSGFWTAFDSGGAGAVRAAKSDGTQLPCKVLYSSDSGTSGTGLMLVRWNGTRGTGNALKLRIYAGNGSASEWPASNYSFGQYSCFDAGVSGFWPDGGGTDYTAAQNTLTMTGSPSVGGAAGPIDGSKATDYDGSTQYGTSTISVPFVHPINLVASGHSDTTAVNQSAISVSDTAGAVNYFLLGFDGTGTSDPIRAYISAASGSNDPAIGYTVGAWSHGAARLVSITSRFGIANITQGSGNTTSRTPSGVDTITVGAWLANSLLIPFDGELSLVGLHNVDRGADWWYFRKEMLDDPDQSDFYGSWTWNAAGGSPNAPRAIYSARMRRN